MNEPKLVSIALVLKPQGIRGSLKAKPLIDLPALPPPDTPVHVTFPDGRQEERSLGMIRAAGNHLLVHFRGVDDRDTATAYRDAVLALGREFLGQIPEGTYFHEQILGMTVRTEEGTVLGSVVSILETGSNDVYVVSSGDREYLIPAIRDVIRAVDVRGRVIVIAAMDGLLD